MNLLNHRKPPAAFLLNDLNVWAGRRGSWVSKGFELQLSDLSYATPDVLNSLQDVLRILLRGLARHERLQFHLTCDGDFNEKLGPYAKDTSRIQNPWVRRVREQRLERYARFSSQGALRRLRIFVFRGRRVDFSVRGWSRASIERELSNALAQLCAEFAEWAKGAAALLRTFGIEFLPLTDLAHFDLLAHTFQPSLELRTDFDPVNSFDPNQTVIEQCWRSEAVGHRDHGFVMDGYEHALLLMSRPPQLTRPGIVAPLAQQPFRNYTLTLTIEPLEVEAVIREAEQSFRRLEGDLVRDRRVGDEAVLEKKRVRAKALREGFLRPFKFRFVVRLWAPDRIELNSRTLAFKQAFQAMAGAQWFEPNLPPTSRYAFEASWPSWVGSDYPHYKHYAEDSWLADLIMLITTFGGHPVGCEALYDSANGGVVSVTLSVANAPQHGAFISRTGGGKSLLAQDLVSQIADYFGAILILDRGGSWEDLAGVIAPGIQPTIIRPNGTITINYLDRHEKPLDPDHIAQRVTFVSLMAGRPVDEEKRQRNEAVIHAAINQLYNDHFDAWERDHPDEAFQLAGLACHLHEKCTNHAGLTFSEAYAVWRDAGAVFPTVDEGGLVSALKDPRHREWVRNLAFARLSADEQPTHSMLVELLRFDFRADPHTARSLADALEKWRWNGAYGPLVDGPNTLKADGRLSLIELGQIPLRDENLLAVATALAQDTIWSGVFARPRKERKLVILEEASALLRLSATAPQLLANAYEQARKMNATIFTVWPAYAPLANSSIRESVMGNSRCFFIGRLDDPQDADRLAADLSLPVSAAQAIKNLPMPTDRASGASFLYYHRHDPQPVCGVLRNVVSPEVYYVAASHGEHVAARREQLKGDPMTTIDHVITNAKSHA